MSQNAIVYDRTNDEFSFNGLLVRRRQLLTIAALLEEKPVEYRHVRTSSGKRSRRKQGRYAEIGQVSLTANYIRQMLQFVDQNGWFIDHTDVRCGDHDFNPNIPTPGSYWGHYLKLKSTARQLLQTADTLEGVDSKSAQQLRERAGVLQRECNRLRAGRRPRNS